jgi:hypothetical protein
VPYSFGKDVFGTYIHTHILFFCFILLYGGLCFILFSASCFLFLVGSVLFFHFSNRGGWILRYCMFNFCAYTRIMYDIELLKNEEQEAEDE